MPFGLLMTGGISPRKLPPFWTATLPFDCPRQAKKECLAARRGRSKMSTAPETSTGWEIFDLRRGRKVREGKDGVVGRIQEGGVEVGDLGGNERGRSGEG